MFLSYCQLLTGAVYSAMVTPLLFLEGIILVLLPLSHNHNICRLICRQCTSANLLTFTQITLYYSIYLSVIEVLELLTRMCVLTSLTPKLLAFLWGHTYSNKELNVIPFHYELNNAFRDVYLFPCPLCNTTAASQVNTLVTYINTNCREAWSGRVWFDIEDTTYWSTSFTTNKVNMIQ